MKSAPNFLTNKFSLCKSARRRRGAAYFDLATELRVRIVDGFADSKAKKKGHRDSNLFS
jgi:hypothetical protein